MGSLRRGKTVIPGESQRSPEKYLDILSTVYPKGTLTLLASSLGVINRVIGSNSPLLGQVIPYKMGVIK